MFVVMQRTGFMPYFLYTWDGTTDRWLTRKDLAKRFNSRSAAQQAADRINARHPDPIHPATVQPA